MEFFLLSRFPNGRKKSLRPSYFLSFEQGIPYIYVYIYITWCVDRCPLPHRRLTNLYKAVKRVIRPYVSLSLSLSPFRARSPRVTLSFSLAS